MKRTTNQPSTKQSKVGRRETGVAATSAASHESMPPVRTLAEQKTDFTAEGAPPPGQVASATRGTVSPVMPTDFSSSTEGADAATGKVESKPMKQAFRDVARGLKDTDRGAEAGRTYRKLKSAVRPPVRRKPGP